MEESRKLHMEQYADANGSLVTIFRNLTERNALRMAESHEGHVQVTGRGDKRTVTITETQKPG